MACRKWGEVTEHGASTIAGDTVIEYFRSAMKNAGIEAPEIIADGKLHRFYIEGDKLQTQNGWYILFDDWLPTGRFGCWKRGISEKWCGKNDKNPSTTEEKKILSMRLAAIKQQREDERRRIYSDCRDKCRVVLQKAKDASSDHPYLKKKGIQTHGIKILNGSLIIPVRDISGNILGIQFIRPNGIKRFKTGTEKHGHFFEIGKSHDSTMILVCEGFATGASLREATGHTVAIAFDANNLKPVAQKLREKYPEMRIVVCSDNDAWRRHDDIQKISVELICESCESRESGCHRKPVFATFATFAS
ncbi:MAG: toprim domain-containing protein [Desulfuromonadales bacterium]|nr:toprim domain-containing protein [Desulfuromonadales bacterium]